MTAIQTLEFKVNNNGNGTANIDVRGLLQVDPAEGTVNCDCAVFGDDPIFDEVLFRFTRLQRGGDFGQDFRFNIDKPFSALDEDRIGKDEIYAEVVVSKNISAGVPPEVLARKKSPTKAVPS